MNTMILDAVALPQKPHSRIWRSVNKYIAESYSRRTTGRGESSLEQRNNLYLLADQVLAFDIKGDFVEVGCQNGATARVLASVIDHHQADRAFHVYDTFCTDPAPAHGSRNIFERNFRIKGPRLPVVHAGNFERTLTQELPEHIAFAHIDRNTGAPDDIHSNCVRECLEAVYPRMSVGAIGVLMDYHDPERTVGGCDTNPGVKQACDRFFRSKPECIQILYGGEYSHAFFRKVW